MAKQDVHGVLTWNIYIWFYGNCSSYVSNWLVLKIDQKKKQTNKQTKKKKKKKQQKTKTKTKLKLNWQTYLIHHNTEYIFFKFLYNMGIKQCTYEVCLILK